MRQTKAEIMEGIDCDESKVIANNTVMYQQYGVFKVIRLHRTDILIFKPSGSIIYHSGGWRTPTTKNRMNEYGDPNIHIRQRDGSWFVVDNEEVSYFYDGMIVKDGRVLEPRFVEDEETTWIRKLISNYCKKIRLLPKPPMPNNGDCWECTFFDQDLKVGEPSGSRGHLISHLEEEYIHGSLIYNALKFQGFVDPTFVLSRGPMDLIANAVRNFLKTSLGIAR